MANRRFLAAAWACFLSAVLGAALLPSFLYTQSKVLQIGIPIVSLGLYIFFMLAFRDLLAGQLGFTRARIPILLLIAGFTVLVAASVLDEFGSRLLPVSVALSLAGSALVGVSAIALGIQLLRLTKELRWPGAILSVLLIIEGFFFCTVVWMALGILVAVLADLTLGLILWKHSGTERRFIAQGTAS